MITRLETVPEGDEGSPEPARSEKSFKGCSNYGDDTQTVTTGMKDCTFSPEPQPASRRLRNIRPHEPKDCAVAAFAKVLKREFVVHPDHEACEKPLGSDPTLRHVDNAAMAADKEGRTAEAAIIRIAIDQIFESREAAREAAARKEAGVAASKLFDAISIVSGLSDRSQDLVDELMSSLKEDASGC
ncbi:unnamed protein product [Clonostachys rhizophaga]|uniref:Uncharacterized protein n=1 Tax=Clonostachys rhizophaga TaxID=160324 RepID=A0A9N9V8J1_9HYPO|nr:unnamed protein product [Clonostachys rhizophaga]